jgi:hypothetical protein
MDEKRHVLNEAAKSRRLAGSINDLEAAARIRAGREIRSPGGGNRYDRAEGLPQTTSEQEAHLSVSDHADDLPSVVPML